MRIWKISAILLLTMALVLAIAGAAAAQTPPAGASKIAGQVSAVDTAANKVTVTPTQGAAVILVVTADTEIDVWGKEPATIADIKVGSRAEASYDAATMKAYEIEVKPTASTAPRQGFFGTVTAISSTSITLDAKQGPVTLTIDANTQFWNPPKKDATASDVKVGDRVGVLAERAGSTMLAKRVMVIPPKPTFEQVTGVVTKISGNDVTITYDTTKTVVAQAPPGILAKVQLGDAVTAVIIRTPGTEKVMLKDIQSSDKVLDRLIGQAASKSGKEKSDAEEAITRNRDRISERLQEVLGKASDDEAKKGIQRAIEKTKLKTAVPGGPPEPPGKSGNNTNQGTPPAKSGNGGRETENPPRIPANHAGRTTCTACHATGVAGAPKFPSNHASFTDALATCQACHKGP